MVGKFAVEQRRRDSKRGARGIAEKAALGRDALNMRLQGVALFFSLRKLAQRRMGDAFCIVLHGGGDHIELRLGHSRLVDNVPPAAEADEHMGFHPIIAFERLGELRAVGNGDGFSVRQTPHLIGGP